MTTLEAPTVERYKAQIREEWIAPATTAAWRKWHPKMIAASATETAALVEAARLEPGMRVLDLASGAGDPALTLARAVGPQGHVTATDLAENLLAIAEEDARAAGLSNMTFQPVDAHSLPFPDATFDRVTCRRGVMYFADPQQALRETCRVLKPGGRLAFSAVGPPEQNPFALIPLGALMKRVEVPMPPPGAPTPFRYARQGSLSEALSAAGFQQVDEQLLSLRWPFPGTAEEQWQMFYELAHPFHPLFASLPREDWEAFVQEVVAGYRQHYDGERVNLVNGMVVATAVR